MTNCSLFERIESATRRSCTYRTLNTAPFRPFRTGILIYEMLVGYPPFYADNPFGIYEKILNGKYEWPRLMDPVAKDLVKKLLVPDRVKRMGNMKNGADDVRRHRWFKHLDWDDVYNKRLTVCAASSLSLSNSFPIHSFRSRCPFQPPIIPQVKCEGDTSNFDEYPEADECISNDALNPNDLLMFEDF